MARGEEWDDKEKRETRENELIESFGTLAYNKKNTKGEARENARLTYRRGSGNLCIFIPDHETQGSGRPPGKIKGGYFKNTQQAAEFVSNVPWTHC